MTYNTDKVRYFHSINHVYLRMKYDTFIYYVSDESTV